MLILLRAGRRRETAKVKMSFVEDDGNVVEVEAEHGKNLLEVAHDNDVDLEGQENEICYT